MPVPQQKNPCGTGILPVLVIFARSLLTPGLASANTLDRQDACPTTKKPLWDRHLACPSYFCKKSADPRSS